MNKRIMKSKIKKETKYSDISLFFIIYFILFINITSFQFFKPFNLLSSNYIALITNEGIIKYDPSTKNETLVQSLSISIGSSNDEQLIAFIQFPLDEGGYIFCRFNDYIYIFDKNLETYYQYFEVVEIKNCYCILKPYTNANGDIILIIIYVKNDKLKLLNYKISISLTDNYATLINETIKEPILPDGRSTAIMNGIFSCELITAPNSANKIIICFTIIQACYICALHFNPEDLSFLNYSNNFQQTGIITSMTSDLSHVNKNSLICLMENSGYLHCLLYDNENKIFNNVSKLFGNCRTNNIGVKCINERNECSVYISDVNEMSIINFDKNFMIKDTDINNTKCYTYSDIFTPNCYSVGSSHISYFKNDDKFSVMKTCNFNNEYTLTIMNIPETCNKNELEVIGLDCDNCYDDNNDLVSSVSSSLHSFIKSSIPNNLISTIPSTILTTIPSTILTTIPSTILTTIPTTILTTIPTTNPTKIPTTSPTTIPINSSIFSDMSTIITKISSTHISLKSDSTSLSLPSSLFLSSTSPLIQSTNLISSTYLEETEIIQFYENEDLIKGKINIGKEKLENNLENIMKIINIGKKYEINGEDYDIKITPINDQDSIKSSFVDFTLCEQILRKIYNISTDEILTILKIEIDKKNEKALTNQIEYAIYNENKTKLNLSYCKNVQIKVTYDIPNESVLNKTMITYYSELGIDIFNNEDSFFNDLCYPFSISNSDVILKDRVFDIYQNYSLCDNGCEYDKIFIENMSVTCSCQIKTEINIEVSPPVFSEIVQDTLKDSNIGVIRCYELVFSFNNKLHNVGFLLFLFFVIINIICIIIYIVSGINNIIAFVFKEMEKNNYISTIKNPKKKKNKMNNDLINDNSTNNQAYNSSLLMDFNNEMTGKKKKATKYNIKLKKNIKKIKKSKSKKNQPIFIFNYKCQNHFGKDKKSHNSSKKDIYNISKIKFENKTNNNICLKKIPKLNEEKKYPGYYNLIQINANNSLKKKRPPESKYILNNYNFKEAIRYETRDFWRIYFICLLSKENILNTFFFKSPLEIQPLRLSLFIFTYSCDFAFNAVFYLNNNISEKYHYKGDSLSYFLLVNNITICVFSVVFSYLLIKSLYLLTNSKYSIESLFREEEKKMRKNKKYIVDINIKKSIYNRLLKIYKIMKIKIICYIGIELSIMIFFLYFITAFCEVYKNTQNSWLYDSFISFLLSILIELLISFAIAILYGFSLKKKIQILYNIVMFIYRIG